jgi:hypothetical protein
MKNLREVGLLGLCERSEKNGEIRVKLGTAVAAQWCW